MNINKTQNKNNTLYLFHHDIFLFYISVFYTFFLGVYGFEQNVDDKRRCGKNQLLENED